MEGNSHVYFTFQNQSIIVRLYIHIYCFAVSNQKLILPFFFQKYDLKNGQVERSCGTESLCRDSEYPSIGGCDKKKISR